jgi:hypothetical protein
MLEAEASQQRVIVAYQPCSPKNRRTMGETVWDQHLCYFESRRESWDPRSMFHHNLISPLRQWKVARDEIMLLGDFNENVYSRPIACSLSSEELRMGKTCQQTTGKMLPATLKHVSKFCGSNVEQFYWSKGLHSPKCDSCGVQDKYTMHICRCKDPSRDQLFHLTINELHSWIESTLGKRAVATTIGAYLHARGEITMQSLVNNTCSDMIMVLEHSDRLDATAPSSSQKNTTH